MWQGCWCGDELLAHKLASGEVTMALPKVVVTRKLPPAVENAVAAAFDARLNANDVAMTASQLADAMKNADAILCTVTDKLTAEHFELGARRVRVIANFGAGVNHIDCDAAKKAGVVVTNTPDAVTDDTADIALGLIIMTMRRMGEGERHLRTGAWSGWRPTHMLGQSTHGKTLGVVGYGRIGRALANRAALALGMKVIWYAPREPAPYDASTAGPADARRVDTLEELLRESDVVSLHCPSTPETHHLINTERLMMMKSTAVLINTARGDVVDEYALAQALRDRVIYGAGLDVYEFEPAVISDLRELERAVLLPHLGSNGVETRLAMGYMALANLEAFFAGKEPPNRVA
jgi:lactate dehydrogenase-like 2-hydroxyacid dehydrogenase